ncbi:MAG: YqaA family protein [Syntrophomonadaceae bacterium]|jgi:membrane protein YqaA with SNARE-associated domain
MLGQMLALFEAYGLWGLLVLAFAESSFFPVPPDLLLIPLCLSSSNQALIYALLCTLASVAGGYLGYVLGKIIGQPLLYRFASAQTVKKVEEIFTRYGAWAMFVAGLTPIPYKVFTISAGIFGMWVPSFILASLLGRGLRFFTEAILIMVIGDKAVSFIANNFEWLTILMALGVIACYYFYKKGQFLGESFNKWVKAIVTPLRRKLRKINENTYRIAGEVTAILGCGAFLTFFLADVIVDKLSQELHQSDMLVNRFIKPYLGDSWNLLNQIFSGWALFIFIGLAIFIWLRQGTKQRIWFLTVSLIGSSAVLWGFSRILLHVNWVNSSMYYSTAPFAYLINDTLWASLSIVFFAGERPLGGKNAGNLLTGGLFLIFLAICRISIGLKASDILISYATAALWAVVLWLIFLKKAYRREKPL